jgi:hypothetical protein
VKLHAEKMLALRCGNRGEGELRTANRGVEFVHEDLVLGKGGSYSESRHGSLYRRARRRGARPQ